MYGRNTSFDRDYVHQQKFHRIYGITHLLGFVEPVDLVKEYNRLSIHPRVRLLADMKLMHGPSGEFTKVPSFFKDLAQLVYS